MNLAWVICIILGVLFLVSLFIIRNLLIKNEKQEDILLSYLFYLDKISRIIEGTNQELERIDKIGIFASDDEIGFFFKNIKEIQQTLNNFNIKNLQIKNNTNKEDSGLDNTKTEKT